MGNIDYISYSDWISLISAVIEKGLTCEEIDKLKRVYPHSVGDSYDTMIYNQLAKLEEYMLKEAVNSFQKRMTFCLKEMDLEIAEMAFVRFKKHFTNCMFFLQIPDYPESVKHKMSDEIHKNMDSFMESFLKYIKKIEYADSSSFIQDYVYISRKNLKKIKNMY
jgi:hypothetical protein